jgi:hypothetical protein
MAEFVHDWLADVAGAPPAAVTVLMCPLLDFVPGAVPERLPWIDLQSSAPLRVESCYIAWTPAE